MKVKTKKMAILVVVYPGEVVLQSECETQQKE